MKLGKVLPKPRESFYWTLGYLMAPTVDRLRDWLLKKSSTFLAGQYTKMVMKRTMSGQDAAASTSQERSQDS